MESKYYDLKAVIIIKTVHDMNFLNSIKLLSFFFLYELIFPFYIAYRILSFNIFYA